MHSLTILSLTHKFFINYGSINIVLCGKWSTISKYGDKMRGEGGGD